MADAQIPKVSIGLPVYNGENYLREAIESLLAQTYTNFELIISDNASTDGTAEMCAAFAASDSRVRYLRRPENVGAVRNFNEIFDEARGEYFKWAAHDDLLEPDYLERCTEVLDENPEVVLAFPSAEVIDGDGAFLEHYDVRLPTDSADAHERFKALLLSWHRCYEIFGLIRSSALRQTSLLPTYWGGDRTLLQELALKGPFHEIREYLFHPRMHATQSITAMRSDDVARTYWCDTKTTGKIVFPSWSVVAGNLDLVRRSRLSPSHKARLCYYVGLWSRQHWSQLTRDLTRAAKQTVLSTARW